MRRITTTGIALALHLAVGVAIWRVPAPRAPEPSPSFEAIEVAVDSVPDGLTGEGALPVAALTGRPATPRNEAERGRAADANPSTAAVASAAEAASSTASDANSADRVIAEGAAGGPATPSANDGWSFRPTTIDPTYMPHEVAVEAPAAAPTSAGHLVEALDQRDVAIGLGRGGPVKSAVDEIVHSSEAPVLGKATFSIDVNADGSVSVSLVRASADYAQWKKLEEAIRARVASKPIRLPPHAHGLRVAVAIDAVEQYPGGADVPKKTGVVATAAPPKIIETKDKIEIVPPYVAVGYQGRKCGVSVAVTPSGISGGGGCAVGAAMRVVETKIVSEERF